MSNLDVWRAVPGTTWIDRAPKTLRVFHGPNGEDMPTSVDRRWLWRIENMLAVSGTTATHRQYHLDLLEYLRESCEHVWSNYRREDPADPVASHRQCFWCNNVEWGEFGG